MAISSPVSAAHVSHSFAADAVSPPTALRRWDGTKRTCVKWASWERDPELWIHHGDCFVYLHCHGRPQKTPSFKIPFSALLAAGCHPFVARFLVTDDHRPRTADEIERWYRQNAGRNVELYVPPPSTSDRKRVADHHLATRNLLAWATRGSLVGKHLGTALVTLFRSMHELRSPVADSVRDLVDYLDEKGYLSMTNLPHRALALLTLAETFQLRELYIRAFVHCVGMRERLGANSEYQNVTAESRRLIAQARAHMDASMDRTSAMLRSFLDEELSEAHVGVSCGIRAHLEGFRGFLLSFYSGKFGYYPPRSFNATVYRTMGDDFALLYKLLKDEGFTSDEMMPSAAAGGICALQLVQSVDARLGFEPLQHALPLLPQPEHKSPTKRVSWLGRRASKSDTRQLEHAAMVRASNWREDVFQNDLVRAYRRFEENLVMSPSKADKQDRVSLADARKARWILIYAVHQTLRHVNRQPPGVSDDSGAPYLLTAPIDNLPSWTESDENDQTDTATEDMSFVTWGSTLIESPKGRIEIKPDIDYFALTHKESCSERRQSTSSVVFQNETPAIERSSSVTRILGSGSPFRRSPLYHEIVVHGYGNGTNDVSFDAARMTRLDMSVKWATRSDSNASQACSSASSGLASTASPAESVATSISTPGSPPPFSEVCTEPAKRWSQQEPASSKAASPAGSIAKSNSLRRRPMSTALEGFSYAKCLGHFVEQESRNMLAGASGITRRHTTTASDPKRLGSLVSQVWPTHLPNIIDEEPCVLAQDSCDWTAMQAFLDGRMADVDAHGDVLPAWEQYADLGGLTEMR
ncbi:choriogenin Hminor [Hirsutella rhossiliensis]|uniref:Choriogenin Hminor n=1 Tax=Hirsutella rhossiliensis TaxID=111463 RepID=A0A9P8SL93_9HYPO|nr:choriogenin Hminor [Hirsutella rhossiliensis]KAH0966019.1 choriogenin Hminor [Hirsutella rhossiliensis]